MGPRDGRLSRKPRLRATRGLRVLIVLLAALGASAIAGCGSSLPGTELPPTREVSRALEFPNLRDYRGVIDCRMRASGLTQASLAEIARNAQIDFIFLGDVAARSGQADYGIAGYTSQILFIPGGAFPIGNRGAEIVGLNISQPIGLEDASARDLIARIHEQGGLAFASEPAKFPSPDDYALADALEVYNLGDAWRAHGPGYFDALLFTSDRLFRAIDVRPSANLAAYDRMASGAQITLAAGVGAAHSTTVLGTKVGTFDQFFRVCTTHLLAPAREIAPLVDALKRGHAYLSFDLLGYVPNFAFYAQNGGERAMMGEQIAYAPGLKLRVEMPGRAGRLVLVHDGNKIGSVANVKDYEFAPTGPGAYRIEAWRDGRPWILSNPIYVR